MTSLAALAGRFIGHVLAACGPTLVAIIARGIHEGLTSSVEDGARRDDLRDRLLDGVRDSRSRGADGGTGASTPDGEAGEGVGG